MARRRQHDADGAPSGSGVLAPTVTVLTNSLTPWLRSRFTVRVDGLQADVPRTLLGLVSSGRRRVTIPLERIADVRVAMALQPVRVVTCVLLLVGGLAVPGPARVALLLVGIWLVPLSYIAVLRVDVRGARRERFPICVFARFDVGLVATATRLEVAARAASAVAEERRP
jgi:hypothetical protein